MNMQIGQNIFEILTRRMLAKSGDDDVIDVLPDQRLNKLFDVLTDLTSRRILYVWNEGVWVSRRAFK